MALKNLSRYIIFVILLCLGFSLMPNISAACAKKTQETTETSCLNKQSKKSEHTDCCKTKGSKKSKSHKDCGSKCQHNSCRCGTSSSSLTLFAEIDLKAESHFAEIKKQKFDLQQSYCFSGYYSIWQPPKIS